LCPENSLARPVAVNVAMKSHNRLVREGPRPRHTPSSYHADCPIDNQPDDSYRYHSNDNDIGAQQCTRVIYQKSEAGIGADQLGCNERHPSDTKSDTNAGYDLR